MDPLKKSQMIQRKTIYLEKKMTRHKLMGKKSKTIKKTKIPEIVEEDIEKSPEQDNTEICNLEFLESLYKDFQYYTENVDLAVLKDYMEKGDEINKRIYDKFCKLEKQYEDLKNENLSNRMKIKKIEQNRSEMTLENNKIKQDYQEEDKILNERIDEAYQKF